MGKGRSTWRGPVGIDVLPGNRCTSLYEYYISIKIFKKVIVMFKNEINIFKNS